MVFLIISDLLDEIYNLNEVEGYENEVSSNSEKLPKNLSDFVTVLSANIRESLNAKFLEETKNVETQ